MKNVVKRVIFATFGIPIFLTILFYGGAGLLSLFGVIVVAATIEFNSICSKKYQSIPKIIYPFNLLVFLVISLFDFYLLFPLFVAIILILSFYTLSKRVLKGSLETFALSTFSTIYIVIPFALAYKIQFFPNGKFYLIATFILIWVSDSFAYIVGMSLGRIRNIVFVSPKKSVEGFIAGFVFPIAGALALYRICPDIFGNWNIFIIGCVVGIFGQLGDIVESIIKRNVEVKDSGSLLFGHGGFLDRFDSFLIAIPVVYFVLRVF